MNRIRYASRRPFGQRGRAVAAICSVEATVQQDNPAVVVLHATGEVQLICLDSAVRRGTQLGRAATRTVRRGREDDPVMKQGRGAINAHTVSGLRILPQLSLIHI